MPTHSNHSALIDMFFSDPGAPWKYSGWQQLTGILYGLFDDDDAKLAPGWTRVDSNDVKSYYYQFNAKGGQVAKIKFATAKKNSLNLRGRPFYSTFVTVLWKDKGIHAIITAIITAHSLHPLQVARASKSGTFSPENLPNAKEYVAELVDPVGLALFGVDCLDKDGIHVDSAIRTSLRAIIIRTWINIRNQIHRSLKNVLKWEARSVKAFDNLEKEVKPTKKMVKKVIVLVSHWKVHAHTVGLEEHIASVTQMDEQLLALMFSIGAKPVKASEKGKAAATKRNEAMLQALLSEGDIDDIFLLYRDFFDNTPPIDSVDLADQHATIAAQFGLNNGVSTDLGISVEAALSNELLAHNLGYVGVLPLLFNNFYHTAGLRAWESESEHLFAPEAAKTNPDMAVLSLHWHQLAGVHAIINMNFTSSPGTQPPGCLIADEVGLGKTFLCAAVIAFFCDIVNQQTMMKHPDPAVRAGVRLPPILKDKPYLGVYDVLPKLCHLIVVPGTLMVQWMEALQMLIKPRKFEILQYPVEPQMRKNFWAPGSPFQASIAGSNLILLASHSVMNKEYSELCAYTKPAASDADNLPWYSYRQQPAYSTLAASSLFGRKYLTVTLDEAQSYRNVGLRHCGALAILNLAVFRMPMTATPIQTSTKDAASMGRLLGIPHFLTKDAYVEEREDSSVLRQMRRPGNDSENDSENASPEALEVMTSIILRMQDHFADRILRRTTDSLDWKGNKLIDLPPCITITLVIKLTPREMEIISEHADNVKESASSSNGVLQICSKDFYLSHRMCIAYARRDLSEPVPEFSSLEEWEPKKSTKFDVCVRLCKHILSRDDAPEVEVVDGQVIYPPLPPLETGAVPEQTIKILISQSYPSLGPLLRNILDLYGVKYLYIDGSSSFDKRAAIVRQFITEPEYRVLIMSSVGSIGLNLTIACVIIFVDQVWSAQDELQIRGRAHRQPQKKPVRCYHILADETADIILAALARGKHHMMEAFLSQDRGKEMMSTIRGQTLADPRDDYDDDHDPKDMRERRVSSSREKKTTVVVSDEERPSARSHYKSASKRGDVDEFDQGASPVRGEEDMLHYRDPATLGGLTDDTMGSANTSSQGNDTSGTEDHNAGKLMEDDDADFNMEDPSNTQSTQSLLPPSPQTPPRKQNQEKEARMRNIAPDSPELARHQKRMRTTTNVGLVDCPPSPRMDVDSDEDDPMSLMGAPFRTQVLPFHVKNMSAGARRAPPSSTSAPHRPSMAPPGEGEARRATHLPPSAPPGSCPSSTAPHQRQPPHSTSATVPVRPPSVTPVQAGDARRAPPLAPHLPPSAPPGSRLSSSAPHERRPHPTSATAPVRPPSVTPVQAGDARRAPLAPSKTAASRPSSSATLETEDVRRAPALAPSATAPSQPLPAVTLGRPGGPVPTTDGPDINQETFSATQTSLAPVHSGSTSVPVPASKPRPKPTPANASSKPVRQSGIPTQEERRPFLKAKPTQSLDDVNRFHTATNVNSNRSSESVSTSASAVAGSSSQSSRVTSQRHTTLSKGGSMAKLSIPDASTKSKNPFSRQHKQKKGGE